MEVLIDEFNALVVSYFINIELIQSEEFRLLINGGGNIIFPAYGDVLMEDWELSSLSVNTLRSLRDFTFSGTADSLFFYLEQGSPDLYLSGNAHYLYVYHFGTGKVIANYLKAHSVHFNHLSTGDFLVYPKENLRVEIRSSGNTRAFHPANNVEIIQVGGGAYLEEF